MTLGKKVFNGNIDKKLRDVCIEISQKYGVIFIEIQNDEDHVHFLIQSVSRITVTKVITIIKSIIAREIFKELPKLRKDIWGLNL